MDIGVMGDGVEEFKDPQVIDRGKDEQHYFVKLQNKVLDRLAETLARFKPDARAKKIT
jgi:hypothetical protein